MRQQRVRQAQGRELLLMHTQSTLERMRGLLRRTPLQAGEGMVLEACNMVHTFGMGYPIDIVFVDRQNRIAKISACVPARRLRGCLSAKRVVELSAGDAARMGWQVGQHLGFLAPELQGARP